VRNSLEWHERSRLNVQTRIAKARCNKVSLSQEAKSLGRITIQLTPKNLRQPRKDYFARSQPRSGSRPCFLGGSRFAHATAGQLAAGPCKRSRVAPLSDWLAGTRYRRVPASFLLVGLPSDDPPRWSPAQNKEETNMTFRPLHDRVVVKRLEGEEKTKGGIIIPTAPRKNPRRQNHRRRPRRPRRERQAGSAGPQGRRQYLFGKWSGSEVKIDGDDLLIMKESDVLGVVA